MPSALLRDVGMEIRLDELVSLESRPPAAWRTGPRSLRILSPEHQGCHGSGGTKGEHLGWQGVAREPSRQDSTQHPHGVPLSRAAQSHKEWVPKGPQGECAALQEKALSCTYEVT